MLQLCDSSPFVSSVFALPDARGVDQLVLAIKATFELSTPLRIAEQQRPVVLADEYWGAANDSSLRYPSEVYLAKPGCDLILVAVARTPGGHPQTQLDVVVGVGTRMKRARVFGDRRWSFGVTGLRASEPEPFSTIPLVYERAFGGSVVTATGERFVEERNPVGLGLRAGRRDDAFHGQPLPNIEDPATLLEAPSDTHSPLGFGAIAPHWLPRRSYAGSYDQTWRRERAPFLPEDFDPRYSCCAAEGLRFEQGLWGGEAISLVGLRHEGPLAFALPRCRFDAVAVIAGSLEPMAPTLERVLIEPDRSTLAMTWRACLPVGDRILRVERVEVGLAQLEGAQG